MTSGKKKFQFLLLDAPPIIELFRLNLWDKFLAKCDVTVVGEVVREAKWASQEDEDICIDLRSYEDSGAIQIVEVDSSIAKNFYDKFTSLYQEGIHLGEKEALAFLDSSNDEWMLCSGDHAVFCALGVLGKGEQGISLEEILNKIGLSKKLEWQFSQRFREQYTRQGEIDTIQDKGLC